MSPTGSGSATGGMGAAFPFTAVQGVQPWSAARIVPLHLKAGFLLIGGEVFAYRYRETTEQLTVSNRDGGAVFPVLTGDDARTALGAIQALPHA